MSEFVDPCIDQETGIFKNLFGARTQNQLDEIEADITTVTTLEFLQSSPRLTHSFEDFIVIHKAIFGEVYPWAGQVRTYNLSKGQTAFLPYDRFPVAIPYEFTQMQNINFLKGFERTDFCHNLAEHFNEMNYIHPFREGNGRTQRVFWTLIARDAGYRINWLSITSEELRVASEYGAINADASKLESLFLKAVGDKLERTPTSAQVISDVLSSIDHRKRNSQNIRNKGHRHGR